MKASSVILSVLLTEIHYTDRVAKMLAIYREMKKKKCICTLITCAEVLIYTLDAVLTL